MSMCVSGGAAGMWCVLLCGQMSVSYCVILYFFIIYCVITFASLYNLHDRSSLSLTEEVFRRQDNIKC